MKTDANGSATKDLPPGNYNVWILTKDGKGSVRFIRIEKGKKASLSVGTSGMALGFYPLTGMVLQAGDLRDQANAAAAKCDQAAYDKAKAALQSGRQDVAQAVTDLNKLVSQEAEETGLPSDLDQLKTMQGSIAGAKQAGTTVDPSQAANVNNLVNLVSRLQDAKNKLKEIDDAIAAVVPFDKNKCPQKAAEQPKTTEQPPKKEEPKKEEKKADDTRSMAPRFGSAPTFAVAFEVSGSSFDSTINGTVVTSSTFPGSTQVSGTAGLISLDLRGQFPFGNSGIAGLVGASVGDYFNATVMAFQGHPKINNLFSVSKDWDASFYAGLSANVPGTGIIGSLFGGVDLQTVNLSQTADQSVFGAGVVNVSQTSTLARPMIGFDIEAPLLVDEPGAPPSFGLFVRAGAEVVFPGTASMNFTTPIPAALTGMGNYSTTVNFDTEVRAKVAVGARF